MRRSSQFIIPGYHAARPPAISQPQAAIFLRESRTFAAQYRSSLYPRWKVSRSMTAAKTLLQLAGADLSLPRLGDACLVLIDLQNEYVAGPLALPGANAAIASAAKLLERARNSGASIFHIAHKGRPGGLFDRSAERGAFV